MMDLQAFVDGMNQRAQRERSMTQMTLGSLRASLFESNAVDPGTIIVFPQRRHYETDEEFASRCVVVKGLASD